MGQEIVSMNKLSPWPPISGGLLSSNGFAPQADERRIPAEDSSCSGGFQMGDARIDI